MPIRPKHMARSTGRWTRTRSVLSLSPGKRIALWPSESINACKQAVYASIDLPIEDALREEAYWLYQATSQTPALKRFKWADEQGAQFDLDNQRAWPDMLVKVQEIKA